MKQGIYCITHKEIDLKHIPKGRIMMYVGAEGKNVPSGYKKDYSETLDNISNKNKSFCELTGFYFFTKNDNDSDVLGLEHYRRFFVRNLSHIFRYHFLTNKDIDKILQTYDVILPEVNVLPISIKDQYNNAHIESDLETTRNVVKELYPEYLKTFDDVMNNNKTYYCNMIIGKSNVVKDYAKWLFDIEFELEKRIDISGRDVQQTRVFGYLSERLLTVYFTYHTEIKICEKQVLLYNNELPFVNLCKRIFNKIHKIFRISCKGNNSKN